MSKNPKSEHEMAKACCRCGISFSMGANAKGSWRWNGTGWEHKCSDVPPQSGYFSAIAPPNPLMDYMPIFTDDELVFGFQPIASEREVLEKLAAYAHQAWAEWMQYLFDKSQSNSDGTVTIPSWAVQRWQRQLNTSYADLLEQEKNLDRLEAGKMMQIMGFKVDHGHD